MVRFHLLVFLALTLAGCNDAPTSVRLQIAAAPSLTLDGLAVTVEGTRHDEPMSAELQLLVPDRWAGVAQRIEVEGTHLGAAIAAGAIVVTPIAGREVTARVTLVDASCDPICNVGEVDCAGDAVVTCELGADDCPVWNQPAACALPTPFCSSGDCSSTCTDECTAGTTRCEGNTGDRMCGQFDSDTCLDWGAAVGCATGNICDVDRCTPAYKLTVVRTGAGTVTSSPTGIVCGATCFASYVANTMVTLTATPGVDATFVGWTGGGCSAAGVCVVSLGAATQVTARFAGTNTWSPLPVTNAPEPRARHTAVWTGSDMIIWGGGSGSFIFNNGGYFDPLTNVWSPLQTPGAPSARELHTAVWTGSEMIMWGGGVGTSTSSNGGRFDPVTNVWSPLVVSGAPSARAGHTAVWTGSEMIVWGGVSGSSIYNIGGRFNPVTNVWSPMPVTGAPSGRAGHTAVWTGSEMIIWGGGVGVSTSSNGGRFDPVTNVWSPLVVSGAPSARAGHTAVWTGSEMIVWGGVSGSFIYNNGGRFNPVTNVWSPLPVTNAPSGRERHSAVWTGSEMIIWGGAAGSALSDGGRFIP